MGRKDRIRAWKIKGNQILQDILVFVQSPPNNHQEAIAPQFSFVHEITKFFQIQRGNNSNRIQDAGLGEGLSF